MRPRVDEEVYEADPKNLLEFARAAMGVGDAVFEQLEDLLAGRVEDLNPNAMRVMRREMYGFSREIDAELDAWKEHAPGEDDE